MFAASGLHSCLHRERQKASNHEQATMFHPSSVDRPSLVITSNSVLVMALWQTKRKEGEGSWDVDANAAGPWQYA